MRFQGSCVTVYGGQTWYVCRPRTGSIPSQLGSLSALRELWLGANELSGE